MKSPLVGIVVPTHNRVSVIVHRCLDSIQAQTISNFHCVVVDDGSTDQTQTHLAPFLASDPRFSYVRRDKAGGPSVARNVGVRYLLENTPIEWIAFCDSDDSWQAHKLAVQLDRLAETGTHVCHTEEQWIRDGKSLIPLKKHRKPEGRIFLNCLPLCCVSPSAVMVHRILWEYVGGFDEQFYVCEDYELWLRLFARFEASLCSDPLVTKYGGHEDQLSRQFVGMDRWRVAALLKTYQNLRDELSSEEQHALLDELNKKSRVLQLGYEKHQGAEAARVFKELQSNISMLGEKPDLLQKYYDHLIRNLPLPS